MTQAPTLTRTAAAASRRSRGWSSGWCSPRSRWSCRRVTGWDVHVRHFPPLHADWDPRVGRGHRACCARRAARRGLGGAAGRAAAVATAAARVVRRWAGLDVQPRLRRRPGRASARSSDTEYEYLRTARARSTSPTALRGWVARIPYDGLPDDIANANWPVHVAGHPPGALSFFVRARPDRPRQRLVGRASWSPCSPPRPRWRSWSRCGCWAPRSSPAGRRRSWSSARPRSGSASAPTAMFAAVAAWGSPRSPRAPSGAACAWSLVAGLLLGLRGDALLRAAAAGPAGAWPCSWWRGRGDRCRGRCSLRVAVVAAYGAFGFWWWEALPALHDRYWAGVAKNRPPEYWMWGNLAALTFSAGPLVWAGLASPRPAGSRRRRRRRPRGPVAGGRRGR